MEGETRDGEIEIEEGAKDLNFGGISRSSREAVDDLPDQLAEPFMFCLVLLLSIVRRDEAAIQQKETETFLLSYERPLRYLYKVGELGEEGKEEKKRKEEM